MENQLAQLRDFCCNQYRNLEPFKEGIKELSAKTPNENKFKNLMDKKELEIEDLFCMLMIWCDQLIEYYKDDRSDTLLTRIIEDWDN